MNQYFLSLLPLLLLVLFNKNKNELKMSDAEYFSLSLFLSHIFIVFSTFSITRFILESSVSASGVLPDSLFTIDTALDITNLDSIFNFHNFDYVCGEH